MNKLKHTPGPWGVEEYDDGSLNIETDYKIGLNDVLICNGIYKSGGFCQKDKETNTQNARLIAAAPEMLEALINAYCNMDSGNFEEIESVVKKATGLPIEEILNEN